MNTVRETGKLNVFVRRQGHGHRCAFGRAAQSCLHGAAMQHTGAIADSSAYGTVSAASA